MQEVTVNVAMMAECRERRKKKQENAIETYGIPCISFSLNIPGSIKDKPLYRDIHKKGMALLEKSFGGFILHRELINGPTGSEAILSVDMKIREIKEITVNLEDSIPIGRIFDMDVIDIDGKSLSRRDLGFPGRKCLICEKEAVLCARSREHSLEELIHQIRLIADKV